MNPNDLAATLKNQSDQIASLQAHLVSRDKSFDLLLEKLQGVSVTPQPKPSTSKRRTSGPQTPKSIPTTPASKTVKTARTPVNASSASKSIKASPAGSSSKRDPNHMIMKNNPSDFETTKVHLHLIFSLGTQLRSI